MFQADSAMAYCRWIELDVLWINQQIQADGQDKNKITNMNHDIPGTKYKFSIGLKKFDAKSQFEDWSKRGKNYVIELKIYIFSKLLD